MVLQSNQRQAIREGRSGSRFLVREGSTVKELEMSRRSRRGDVEGVAGGEYERGSSPPLAEGSGGASSRKFFKIWVLSLAIYTHSSALFQRQDFSSNLKKISSLQINEQIINHINVMNIHENQEQDQARETASVYF